MSGQPAKETEWPETADGYQQGAVIGHGAFAPVYKARVLVGPHKGEEVAIKVIDLEAFADSSMEEIRRELVTMRNCDHPNVIRYFVAIIVKHQLWLVMPLLAGGSCLSLLRATAPTGFKSVGALAYILLATARAMAYFHANKLLHRDLKAGNILLGADAAVQIADFGVSASLKEEKTRTTFVGTPCWMAPEVLEQSGGYNEKADVWSFGITAIELAQGEAPFQRFPPLKVMMMILQRDPPQLTGPDWDPDFADLVNSCLQKDPQRRPSMEQILQVHQKFFRKADPSQLVELLRRVPPLEQRGPTGLPEEVVMRPTVDKRPVGVSWDFGETTTAAPAGPGGYQTTGPDGRKVWSASPPDAAQAGARRQDSREGTGGINAGGTGPRKQQEGPPRHKGEDPLEDLSETEEIDDDGDVE
uniref:Protein kinase domain-containing protein n=1 Tax=Chromera velia CCMP2878 TaxID=1169474 RepID=A0A0G4HXM9_9ALVE|mmetsp:Transcript_34245/g.67703  ORF Transcript_34245/g.67703 Transcript_34245/m.67703 type:complete len:415 (-) Transcript_34245:327-1571(-)|eukprot:Cvel_9298.t1-p1 / transcript=Cvel_9298.t1 / gene=Cvel_9298 / organism=Chromera_velia_CCMP2878 / gene_product=STE20/SPS1-related proline-alanine-rich protein, putative / transcript_product=STE20/SPS1-related proline-alanine-rich protein, putative / location=Cvel_scaffold532:46548-53095(-) / protein_length=414 / sequence_SO=supercontig / SO=protein_coding / is_pseudo=false